MAVGTVSSAQNQGAASPATIASGEKIATTAAALKDPKAKTYYHQVPGAKFIMPNGLEVVFLGGQFATADAAIIEELDKVVDRSTSLIYSGKGGVQSANAADKSAASDAATS